MNLRDMSPAPDDPMEALFGFHRRLERDLAALGRLPPHLESFGLDVAASAAAAGLLHGLGTAAALHHAQEEHELMPLLERRIARPGERDAFRALRQGIEADHREIELLWRSLRRPLKAIGEGLARRLPVDEIQYFRAIWTTHISAEEASLHLLALRHLLPVERAALAQRIRARRERGLRAA